MPRPSLPVPSPVPGRTRQWCASAALLLLCVERAAAAGPGSDGLVSAAVKLSVNLSAAEVAAAEQGAAQEMYLEVSVNAEETGLVLRFGGQPGRLSTSAASLRQLGVVLGRPAADAEELVLDDIAGLRYTYDAARQRISLVLADHLRAPFRISTRPAPAPPEAGANDRGALINYDAAVQLGSNPGALLANEVRYFNRHGVLTSSGIARLGQGNHDYLRYNTAWSMDDPLTLRSLQLGDLISSSLSWNRSVRLGGVQWRKNFGLRPDLPTFPVASLRGSALVPSALSLYVNGVQQASATVPAGPYELSQVSGISGAGEARIVTRDALGRETFSVVPLYVDTRLLAPGLSDWSVETGVLRRDFGARSFSYGSAPVATASARQGLTQQLTVEAHGELSGELVNAGAGLLLALKGYGVLTANLAASVASGVAAAPGQRGRQLGIGYQYQGRGLGVDAYSMRAGSGYGDLATGDGSPAARGLDRLTVSSALFGGQSVGVSYVGYRTAGLEGDTRIASVNWSATIGPAFLSASAYRDLRRPAQRGVYFNLSFALGERMSSSLGGGRQGGVARRGIQLLRSPDIEGGLGWDVQAGQNDRSTLGQGQVHYLGRYGRLGALVQHSGERTSTALDASGSLVVMDGTVAATRQVGAGFALVSTGGVAGVPVIHEHRRIGVTNASGHLLVPNLNPYGSNQIAIDPSDLPADARVRVSDMQVAPRALAGVLARFPVERYSAATVLLRGADSQPIAPGTPLRHRESGGVSIVGHDGIAFIDDLDEDNTLEVGEGAQACVFRFRYLRAAAASLPTIGPLHCTVGKAP